MTKRPSKQVEPTRRECDHAGEIPIQYGYPDTEMRVLAREGKIKLGGCIVRGDNPTRYCPKCGRHR